MGTTKIAILTCRKHAAACTLASCLTAWRERTGTFARYERETPCLAAVLDCGGCPECYDDGAMDKKLNRLEKEGITAVHLTGCVNGKCPRREEIIAKLEAHDLRCAGV